MKKTGIFFLCIIICISLFGCSQSSDVDSNSQTSVTTADVSSETSAAETSNSKSTQTETSTSDSAKSTLTTSEKETSTSSSQTKSATTSKKAAATTKKSATTSAKETTTAKKTTSKNTTTKKSTTKKSTTKKTTTATATEISCTVTIECTSILDNMDDLKAGHEAYVPSDGIILNSTSVTVSSGSTVYDALTLACSKGGVTVSSKSSAYGKYIVGFNNIDEKDCGSQSGWTYTVNGKYPSKSCDKYTLSNGDKVVFIYTCSY
ncbi:MAG: DUF4430 domain-containing protein [Clostridiales bacterium]|nr:DUF4430 domain-containing protein [Clostridiales bacterium]